MGHIRRAVLCQQGAGLAFLALKGQQFAVGIGGGEGCQGRLTSFVDLRVFAGAGVFRLVVLGQALGFGCGLLGSAGCIPFFLSDVTVGFLLPDFTIAGGRIKSGHTKPPVN